MYDRVNLSHTDMDGAGSNLVLRERFGDMESYHVSYGAVKETLQMIDSEITIHTKTLFVTDLSFDKEAFNELMRIAEAHKNLNIIYIDHHPYEGEVLEAFEELKTFENVYTSHVIGKSATRLCYEFTRSENKDLGKLVSWIDAYDIYKQEEDPQNFKIGWFLNTIFWQIKMSGFKSNLMNNNFKIPKFFKELYKTTVEDKDDYFAKQIKNGLVVFDDDARILLAFSDKYKSDWQMDYKDDYDYFVLPYHTKSKNMSIRFSHRINDYHSNKIKDDILAYVRQTPWHISSGGHHRAFGITLDTNMPEDEHLTLIEGIVEVIESWNTSFNNPQ